jgi:hypothetical protein
MCTTLLKYSQLKGEDCASVDKPPNHKLFDPNTPKLSPVLQRRLDNENAKNAKAIASTVPVAPVINFSFGKEIIEMFRPHPAAVPTTPPATVAATAPAPASPARSATARSTYDLQCPTLLQANRTTGPDMPIAQFCIEYELGKGIEEKLVKNSYLHTRVLHFVTIEELKEMKFRFGEVALLRDAVERWSAAL